MTRIENTLENEMAYFSCGLKNKEHKKVSNLIGYYSIEDINTTLDLIGFLQQKNSWMYFSCMVFFFQSSTHFFSCIGGLILLINIKILQSEIFV